MRKEEKKKKKKKKVRVHHLELWQYTTLLLATLVIYFESELKKLSG